MAGDPRIIAARDALPGREQEMPLVEQHFVLGTPMTREVPEGYEIAVFGMGCFWGAERKFWQIPGVHATAAGYACGYTPNPTYREVCSGGTGHAEVVRVVYDPNQLEYATLLQTFWDHHDPTQGMRQGNDRGTQYRSVIATTSELQQAHALASRAGFADALATAGQGAITTTIQALDVFYFAEPEHQQYLGHNPNGYCGLRGTGVSCPVPALVDAAP